MTAQTSLLVGMEVETRLPEGEAGGRVSDREQMRDRLLAKSEPAENGCRLWLKDLNGSGYGKLTFHGQKVLAHRAAVYVATGEWPPPWLYVMHACDTPRCIASEHLSLGSPRDNVLDAVRKGRAGRGVLGTCPNGHPYDDASVTASGQRRCRTCRRASDQRHKARRDRERDRLMQRARRARKREGRS